MKHAITIIFIFFFVISCQTNEKPINATPIVDKEELIKNFKRIIHGSWVQTSYVVPARKLLLFVDKVWITHAIFRFHFAG